MEHELYLASGDPVPVVVGLCDERRLVPAKGRESSEVARIRSSGVRSARSSPSAWPRSSSDRRGADVRLELTGGGGEDHRAAVQGKHEPFAVEEGGEEEQPDAVQARIPGGPAAARRVVYGEPE